MTRATHAEPLDAPRKRLPASERREQILEVAREAFLRAGYRGTTALEIGREAGVSEKLVLKHFGTKDGLFRAAVAEPLLALMAAANEDARERLAARREDDTPEEAFERVHRFLVTWAALVRDRAPLLFTFLGEMHQFPDVAQQLVAMFEQQVDESSAILRIATQHEAFRPFDTRVAFLSALGAVTVAALSGDDPETFLGEYLKLTLFGVFTDEARDGAREAARETARSEAT